MKTEFHFGGIRFGVTDRDIPEVDSMSGHGTPENMVGIYVDHQPLGTSAVEWDRKVMFYLKPSEARTIASAIMTAAQSAR